MALHRTNLIQGNVNLHCPLPSPIPSVTGRAAVYTTLQISAKAASSAPNDLQSWHKTMAPLQAFLFLMS